MFEIQQELRTIRRQQDLIIRILFSLAKGEERMSAELDALVAQVAINSSVEASAVDLIKGLAAQIAAAVASNDGPALADLATKLHASADALGAAVTANTPAAPAPAPVADPAPTDPAAPAA